MSLSSYLEHLVQKGMIEVEAAEKINQFTDETTQARKVKDYLEGKKRLLQEMSDVHQERAACIPLFFLAPYKSYLERPDVAQTIDASIQDFFILMKRLGTGCPFCRGPMNTLDEHPFNCIAYWSGVELSAILMKWEKEGKASPSDVTARIELEKTLKEISDKIDALRQKSPSPASEEKPAVRGAFPASETSSN